jgi:hypothetical protein
MQLCETLRAVSGRRHGSKSGKCMVSSR